jgi:hypothetical protein
LITWVVIVCLRIRLHLRNTAGYAYYSTIREIALSAGYLKVWASRLRHERQRRGQALGETVSVLAFSGQDGVERTSRHATLHILEPGLFE